MHVIFPSSQQTSGYTHKHANSTPPRNLPHYPHELRLFCHARQELGNKNIIALPCSTCSITLTSHIQHPHRDSLSWLSLTRRNGTHTQSRISLPCLRVNILIVHRWPWLACVLFLSCMCATKWMAVRAFLLQQSLVKRYFLVTSILLHQRSVYSWDRGLILFWLLKANEYKFCGRFVMCSFPHEKTLHNQNDNSQIWRTSRHEHMQEVVFSTWQIS